MHHCVLVVLACDDSIGYLGSPTPKLHHGQAPSLISLLPIANPWFRLHMQLSGPLPVLLALQVILPLPLAVQPHLTPLAKKHAFARLLRGRRWWKCCRLLRGRRLLWGRHGSSRMSVETWHVHFQNLMRDLKCIHHAHLFENKKQSNT